MMRAGDRKQGINKCWPNGIAIVCVVAYKLSLCMHSGSDACNMQLS